MTRGRLAAAVVVGTALYAVAIYLVATADLGEPRALITMVTVAGLIFSVAGTIAAIQRPDNRTGAQMLADRLSDRFLVLLEGRDVAAEVGVARGHEQLVAAEIDDLLLVFAFAFPERVVLVGADELADQPVEGNTLANTS